MPYKPPHEQNHGSRGGWVSFMLLLGLKAINYSDISLRTDGGWDRKEHGITLPTLMSPTGVLCFLQ